MYVHPEIAWGCICYIFRLNFLVWFLCLFCFFDFWLFFGGRGVLFFVCWFWVVLVGWFGFIFFRFLLQRPVRTSPDIFRYDVADWHLELGRGTVSLA